MADPLAVGSGGEATAIAADNETGEISKHPLFSGGLESHRVENAEETLLEVLGILLVSLGAEGLEQLSGHGFADFDLLRGLLGFHLLLRVL
jgi:hypothetical protein